jgi:soluble lytic murein transglycosylase-like protein
MFQLFCTIGRTFSKGVFKHVFGSIAAACLIASVSAHAGTTVFKTKSSTGTTVFSDAPVANDTLVRTSYQTNFGRPTATKSCTGLSKAQMAQRATEFESTMQAAANQHNVDVKLIKAIAQIESCFDRKAQSKVGAQGLMQLMPGTAKEMGVSDSFNASQNIHGGTAYFARMLKRFKRDHRLALAAYNAGPGNVDKYNGIPPFPETQHYVKKVLAVYQAE